MEFDRTDAGEMTDGIPDDLLIRIKNDPAFFISFSDERQILAVVKEVENIVSAV